MLGSGIMVVGLFLAVNASITAFRMAPDRGFAVAALVVAGAEIVAIALAAMLPFVMPV
jgi:hypothetical protein